MPIFSGELGLQFVTHLANHYTVPDLVRLAQFAADKGFRQIWVNDNIRYRGQLVVLTAIASRVPIQLGTAIMVPYFHNPLDVADCLAALAELCGGREMDGLISSGIYIPMLKAGRLPGMLATADQAAKESEPNKRLRKICELNVSISRDREKAIEFPKRQVAHSILQWEALGFTAEEYARMGVERQQVLQLKEAFESGATVEEAAKLVTEHMVKTYYAAGTPEEVRDQIIELVGAAGRFGYDHVAFAKLGPDYEEAINLLADQVVPVLR